MLEPTNSAIHQISAQDKERRFVQHTEEIDDDEAPTHDPRSTGIEAIAE